MNSSLQKPYWHFTTYQYNQFAIYYLSILCDMFQPQHIHIHIHSFEDRVIGSQLITVSNAWYFTHITVSDRYHQQQHITSSAPLNHMDLPNKHLGGVKQYWGWPSVQTGNNMATSVLSSRARQECVRFDDKHRSTQPEWCYLNTGDPVRDTTPPYNSNTWLTFDPPPF